MSAAEHLRRIIRAGVGIEGLAATVASVRGRGSHQGGRLGGECGHAGALTAGAMGANALTVEPHKWGQDDRSRGLRLRVEIEHALRVPVDGPVQADRITAARSQ